MFKAYEQRQGRLFPAFLDEGLDPSDPVFWIDDIVDGLDLTALEARYAVRGEHAYSPRMLLKLWLYAASQGVFSGREIGRRLRYDLRFRYLAGEGPWPDFRTINRFRERHAEDFAAVFRETVRLARAAGLGGLGIVAVDGTKLRANTSRHKAMSYGRMRKEEKRLDREIAQLMNRMDQVNRSEDERYGDDDDGSGGLPTELQDKQTRREKIRSLRKQLEAERGERLTERSQKSFADPEAEMMVTGDGSLQYAYNAQAAVSEDGILVATGLTSASRDCDQLEPMVEAVGHGGGPGTGARRQWLSHRGRTGTDARAGATLPGGDCAGGQGTPALAQGARNAAHASDPSLALGPGVLPAPQDPGRETLRGDQGRHGLSTLRPAAPLESSGRVEPGVRGLQPQTDESPDRGHRVSCGRPASTGCAGRTVPDASKIPPRSLLRANLGSGS
jgi:transposase